MFFFHLEFVSSSSLGRFRVEVCLVQVGFRDDEICLSGSRFGLTFKQNFRRSSTTPTSAGRPMRTLYNMAR